MNKTRGVIVREYKSSKGTRREVIKQDASPEFFDSMALACRDMVGNGDAIRMDKTSTGFSLLYSDGGVTSYAFVEVDDDN